MRGHTLSSHCLMEEKLLSNITCDYCPTKTALGGCHSPLQHSARSFLCINIHQVLHMEHLWMDVGTLRAGYQADARGHNSKIFWDFEEIVQRTVA